MAEPARSSTRGAVPAGAALFPLRVFLGATFIYAGMQKLSDPGYLTPGASTYIGTQLRQFANGTPGGFILRALAIPHPGLAGVLAALVELVVGVLVLAGWVTRLAALGGLILNLLLFLTNSWKTHPYFLGSDIVFVFAWLPLVLAGAVGQPSVDTWLARRLRGRRRTSAPAAGHASGGTGLAGARGGVTGAPGLTRRAALGAGLVAAATAVLAGASLIIRSGRSPAAVSRRAQLGGPGTRATGSRTATSSATTSATSASASSSSAAGLPSGAVRLGPLARLPLGHAAVYRDPHDGAADLAIRASDGSVTALSAICTHAGCQVSYQGGAAGGQLVCPCHGSVFDARTGAVIQGPAVASLPKRQVVIHDGILYAVPA